MIKPLILISNDDGIDAPGIKHLWQAIKDHAETCIVAPKSEQSCKGLGVSICKTIHIQQESWEEETVAWSVTGTPADCIKSALSILLPSHPTLIISGINRGTNAGRTVLYSGTVGAVIEGALRGIPGIAFSSFDHEKTEYALFERHIPPIIDFVLKNPLPKGSVLNVNFPSMIALNNHSLSDVRGIKLARQGKQYWIEDPICENHKKSYYIDAKLKHFDEAPDSDIFWLEQGFITCVPIHIEELTDHSYINDLKTTFEQHTFSQKHQGDQVPAACAFSRK